MLLGRGKELEYLNQYYHEDGNRMVVCTVKKELEFLLFGIRLPLIRMRILFMLVLPDQDRRHIYGRNH